MTASDFRRVASEKVNAQMTNSIIIYLIFFVITSFALGTVVGEFVLMGPLTLGLVKYAKMISKGEKVEIEVLFKGIENFVAAMIVWIIKTVFTFLWSLLFVIPGLVKHYAYSMSMYLLEETPTLDPLEAIKRSQDMMQGHKWRLFCLEISYIGWFILSAFTFGILLLWVMPKFEVAHYEFFLDLKQQRHVEVVDIKEIR
ncbi:MAG: DUF975 family protein [Bacilli bacterium]|jgi:uncharacterized membrane protein